MKNNLNEQDFNNLYLVSFSLSSIQRTLPRSFVFYFFVKTHYDFSSFTHQHRKHQNEVFLLHSSKDVSQIINIKTRTKGFTRDFFAFCMEAQNKFYLTKMYICNHNI